jgi:hypothetical protein
MYSLKVKKDMTTPQGVLYLAGHECKQLTAFEAAELLHNFPEVFEPADELTSDFSQNKENLKHLSEAAGRLHKGK